MSASDLTFAPVSRLEIYTAWHSAIRYAPEGPKRRRLNLQRAAMKDGFNHQKDRVVIDEPATSTCRLLVFPETTSANALGLRRVSPFVPEAE